MRRPALSAALIAVALGASAATTITPVSAEDTGRVGVDSTITIRPYTYDEGTDTVTFPGRVVSNRAFCERDRKVRLRQTDLDILVGTDTTNHAGRWKISFTGQDVPPGVFRATVVEKVVRRDGRRYVCGADSAEFDAGGPRLRY